MEGKVLLLDPGRHDHLFGIHENSMPEKPMVFRWTRNQEQKQQRMTWFRKTQEKVKREYPGSTVQEAKDKLTRFNCHALDPDEFDEYIKAQSEVWDVLSTFYMSTQTVHADSRHQFHAKHKQLLSASDTASEMQECKAHPYLACEPQNYPLHHKLCLSAYLNKERMGAYLARELRHRFKRDVVIGIGNWSVLMQCFHEPQRGKGMCKMLCKHRFAVCLVDEYMTSKTCPVCLGCLETFKDIPNPRPGSQDNNPIVHCHGLLHCQNVECLGDLVKADGTVVKRRWYWNWDMSVALNFRHILFGLLANSKVPNQYLHPWIREQMAAEAAEAAEA
ncbi:hypothetical protein LPJ61_001400, partial [Coemansia biformis]